MASKISQFLLQNNWEWHQNVQGNTLSETSVNTPCTIQLKLGQNSIAQGLVVNLYGSWFFVPHLEAIQDQISSMPV